MSLMTCPKYGTTSCAGGVCHVCGTLGEDVRDCAPEDDVIEVDSILGYTQTKDENFRRPTTLIRETVRNPKFDRRPVARGYEERSREDAEMWCDRCKRRHGVVWAAPSDLWNEVMREGDRGKPDEFNFCCPICFMQLADERGVGNFMWDVRTWEPAPEPTS